MKRFWTWSRTQEWHLRSFEQTSVFYEANVRGRGGKPTADGTGLLVYVYDTLTGQTMIQARYDAMYGGGGGVIVPPSEIELPVLVGNWTINATVTAQTIEPGYHYVAADPSKPLFTIEGSNLVGCHATPGQPVRMTSSDHFFYGFGNRLDLRYIRMDAVNPGIAGEVKGRAVKGEECKHLVFLGNEVRGTSGIEIKGKSGVAPFAAYLGDRGSDEFRILYNDVLDIDGRVSNGQGTGEDDYRRGNVGGTHGDADWRWNPAVPVSERTSANKLNPAKYAPTSWMPCQFVQLQKITQHPSIEIAYNRVINRPKKSRVEDNINFYAGSGGTEANPARVHHNYVQGAYAYDHNFDPATSTVYDSSNQITLNVDGYNPPGFRTTYSGSIFILDSYNSSSWEDNAHYTEVTDNYGVGHQIQAHFASYVKVLRNRVYYLKWYAAGIPFSYNYAGYFMENKGVMANDSGTSRVVASGSELRDNVFSRSGTGYGNTSGVASANKTNNTYLPELAAGEEAAVQSEWLNKVTAANITLGIPADRRPA